MWMMEDVDARIEQSQQVDACNGPNAYQGTDAYLIAAVVLLQLPSAVWYGGRIHRGDCT
jgi:hypothetical protein